MRLDILTFMQCGEAEKAQKQISSSAALVMNHLRRNGWEYAYINFYHGGYTECPEKYSDDDICGFVSSYEAYVQEKGLPDAVLTVDFPEGCFAAKKVMLKTGKVCRTISWLTGADIKHQEMAATNEFLAVTDAHFVSDASLHEFIRARFPDSRIFDVFDMKKCVGIDENAAAEGTASFDEFPYEGAYDNTEAALKDFEYKLRETALNSEQLFKLKDYGSLYCGDKLSLILPCYNVEEFVGECIESILASKFPLSMLEIICVNDASSDNTLNILKEHEERYPDNIILVDCEQNGDVSRARNIGFMYASGTYIGYIDSDDLIMPDMLLKLYEKAALYNCDISECGFQEFCGDEMQKKYVWDEYFAYEDVEEYKKIYMLGTRIHVWAKLYRKSFLEAVGVSYPEGLRYEDSYFSIICAAYAGRLYVIKDILYLYRQNPDSIMHSDRTKYYYMDGFYVAEKTYEELKRRNLLDRYREQIAAYYFNNSYFKTLCLMTSHMYGMELDMKNLQMIVNRMFELFPDILENQCLINSAEKYPEIGKAMKLLEKK